MTLIVYLRQNPLRLSWHAVLHKNLKLAALSILIPVHSMLSFKLRQNLTPPSLWFHVTRGSDFGTFYVINYAINRKFVTDFIITIH